MPDQIIDGALKLAATLNTNVSTSGTLGVSLAGVSRLKLTPTANNLTITLPIPLTTDSGKLLIVENGSTVNTMTVNGEVLEPSKVTQYMAGTLGGVLQWRPLASVATATTTRDGKNRIASDAELAAGADTTKTVTSRQVRSQRGKRRVFTIGALPTTTYADGSTIEDGDVAVLSDGNRGTRTYRSAAAAWVEDQPKVDALRMDAASDTLKIEAALAAASALNQPVELNAGVGNGFAPIFPPSVMVRDNRRFGTFNYIGQFSSSQEKAWGLYRKATSTPTFPNSSALQHLFFHIQQGGTYIGPPQAGSYNKSNWIGVDLHFYKQSPGQATGKGTIMYDTSHGDTQGDVSITRYGGRITAGGGEGIQPVRAAADQIGDIFTSTVGTLAGNILTPASNATMFAAGQGRDLINLTSGIHSTGTITGWSGTPTIVAGSGTNFTALGSGVVTGLYFAMDQDLATYGKKVVYPIRSINSDTSITLDLTNQGLDMPLPTAFAAYSTFTYKIYKGSQITQINDANITIATPGNFAVGNSFEQPIGYGATVTAAFFSVFPLIPHASIGLASTLNQSSTIPVDFFYLGGGIGKKGVRFTGTLSDAALWMDSAVGTSGLGPLVSYVDFTSPTGSIALIRLLDGGGFNKSLSFQRTAALPYGYLTMGGNWGIDTAGNMALGTAPTATEKLTILATGTQLPLYVEHNGSQAELARLSYGGIPAFNVFRTRTFLNNGAYLEGFSDNQTTRTWKLFTTGGIGDFTALRLGAGGGTGPTWTQGAGTPEGVVSAPVGSLFSRTDGGAVTSLYVKETGSGNTGWTAK